MSRQPIAFVGDAHNCPLHGPNAISAGGKRIIDKKPVAWIGDPCDCGAVIVDGSSRVTTDHPDVIARIQEGRDLYGWE